MVAWNSGPYLREAVAGVLAQTERDWELLLVDNDSKDGAVEAALAGVDDARIRVLRNATNLGATGGIASALPHVRADLVALHDADDVSHPHRLALQCGALDAHPELAAVSCTARIIDAQGRPHELMQCLGDPEFIRAYGALNPPATHPTLVLRRRVFATVAYRGRFMITDDYDFVIRAAETFQFGAVSLPLYYYRSHAASATKREVRPAEANACAVRLCTARRRAGGDERLEATLAQVRTLLAADAPLARIYREFARVALAEDFAAVGTLHAALAIRHGAGPAALWLYLRGLVALARRGRGGWGVFFGGLYKGPFWAALRAEGHLVFPRY